MTSIRIPAKYQSDLYYPVLVPVGGGNKIVEMRGCDINNYNKSRDNFVEFDAFIDKCADDDYTPTNLTYSKLLEYPSTTLEEFIHKHRHGWNGKIGKIAQTLSRILYQINQ